MCIRIADGDIERRTTQQVSQVAGVAEVPNDSGQVTQGWSTMFLVLQRRGHGGGLATVLLMHPARQTASSAVLPVVALDHKNGQAGADCTLPLMTKAMEASTASLGLPGP